MRAQGFMRRATRYGPLAVVVLAVLASAAAAGAAAKRSQPVAAAHRATVKPADDPPNATAHDLSPPLADIAPSTDPGGKEKKEKKQKGLPLPPSSTLPDPVVQSTEGAAAAPALRSSEDRVNRGETGRSRPETEVGIVISQRRAAYAR